MLWSGLSTPHAGLYSPCLVASRAQRGVRRGLRDSRLPLNPSSPLQQVSQFAANLSETCGRRGAAPVTQAGELGRLEEVRVLRAVTRGIDLVTFGVSFHLSLHRLLAQMLMAAVPYLTAPIQTVLPAEYRRAGFLAALLEDILAIVVCVAQVSVHPLP